MEQVNPCWQGWDSYMPSENTSAQDTFPDGYLGQAQSCGLGFASLSNLLVLGFGLGEDDAQIQVPVVVNGEDHAGALDWLLQLGQLLCSRAGIYPQEMPSIHLLKFPMSTRCQPCGNSGAAQGNFFPSSVFQASQSLSGSLDPKHTAT